MANQKKSYLIKLEDINADIRLGMLDFEEFSLQNDTISKRDMEQKGVLFLIKEMLKTYDFRIVYDAFNKPFLEGRQEQISISHSHKWLAIAMHTNKDIGVDIELVRDKVINIKHKFATAEELNYAGSDSNILTLLWSAKEAIYKTYGKKNVEFKKICIKPFQLKTDGEIFGSLQIDNEVRNYQLLYKKEGEYFLALVTHEI